MGLYNNDDDSDDQKEDEGAGIDSEEGSPKQSLQNGDEQHMDEQRDDDGEVNNTSSNVAKDPKSEKDEKKRLEKERKEQEKREKEETKRLKKEEEKQKKEEAKLAKKSGAPSRREEREEKKKFSMPTLFSPKREGVRPKHGTKCRVLLLDGSDVEMTLDRYAYGQHLVDKVCEYVNLLEKDFFSITYQDKYGVKFWLIHDRRIIKQMEEGVAWVFEFAVKFYSPEPTVLQEDITRYEICLQIRNDILSGQLPCSFVTYALLGSYTVQSELGDFDPQEHGSGIDYIRDIQFSPSQTDDLLEKIAELHRTHRGQTPAEAELHFLENAKKLQLYGVHLHPAKDAELVDIDVGVSAGGITIFRDGIKMNKFPWPKILKIAYRKKTFYLKIRAGEFEHFQSTIGFKLATHKLTKRLWRMAIEHHTFFRLKEPLPVPTGVMSQFGSKHRYSGRTHYQSRLFSSSIDREGPSFERNSSRRLASSRSMDYSFDQDGKMRTGSLDMRGKKKSYNEYEEINRSGMYDDDKQKVSVLAGTGPDVNRVAYVKTVKPSEDNRMSQLETSFDGRHEKNNYAENRDDSPQMMSSFVADVIGETKDGDRNRSQKSSLKPSTLKTVPVETHVSFDDENESLPPYPQGDDSFQQQSERVEQKRKPKKKTTTTKTSKHTYTSPDGTVVTEYKTEKNGVIETSVEKNLTISYDETDIDHDLALAAAIQNVTDMNADLAVEKIEVKTKPEVKSKPKTKKKPVAVLI